jgi:hypothetical protein
MELKIIRLQTNSLDHDVARKPISALSLTRVFGAASCSGPGRASANKKERAGRPALDHRLIPKPELLNAI